MTEPKVEQREREVEEYQNAVQDFYKGFKLTEQVESYMEEKMEDLFSTNYEVVS